MASVEGVHSTPPHVLGVDINHADRTVRIRVTKKVTWMWPMNLLRLKQGGYTIDEVVKTEETT